MLTPELELVREAFGELSTCRPAGMGPTPIPWTAIHEYAEVEGVVDEHRFRTLIRRMEREVMDAHRRRSEERDGG